MLALPLMGWWVSVARGPAARRLGSELQGSVYAVRRCARVIVARQRSLLPGFKTSRSRRMRQYRAVSEAMSFCLACTAYRCALHTGICRAGHESLVTSYGHTGTRVHKEGQFFMTSHEHKSPGTHEALLTFILSLLMRGPATTSLANLLLGRVAKLWLTANGGASILCETLIRD